MHLDFKLENAILMPSEHNANVKSVKIIDFGGARKINSYFDERRNINEEIQITGRIYTKIYGSPEIISIDKVGSGWWLPLEIGSHLISPKNTEIVQTFS
jgi:serine/threonine protein kinase